MPPAGSDRDRVFELLRHHRLTGLWYSEARERSGREPAGELEEGLRVELRDRYLRTALHSVLVVEAAQRARRVLADVGVPSIVFKGAALLQNGAYGDPGARSVDDADVLVPAGAAGAAVRALESSGFEPWVEWDERRVGWLPAFSFADPSAPAGMEVTLDLHWRTPYTSFRSGADDRPGALWDGADFEAGLPAGEPHFLVLAEHFLKHLRVVTHLRGIGDLVRALDRIERPDVLTSLAAQRGSVRGLRAMLAFLRDALGVSVPVDLLSCVEVPARTRPARSSLLAPGRLIGAHDAPPVGRIRGLMLQWSLTGSPMGLLRDVQDVVVPPAEWLARRYPEVSGRWGARRLSHMRSVGAWLLGRGVSPLSPNQEFEA